MIKTLTKATWEARLDLVHTPQSQPDWEASGQEFKQEQRQEPWNTGLLPMSCLSLLSHTTQVHLSKVGTTHSRWAFPHQSLVRKMLHRLDKGQPDRGKFSTEVSSSQVTLVYVNLTKPNQHIFLFLKSKWPMPHYFYIYLWMCTHVYGVALSQRFNLQELVLTSTGRVLESQGDQTLVIRLGAILPVLPF